MQKGLATIDKPNATLFCLQVKLCGGKLEFSPSMADSNGNDGFMQIIVRLMDEICSIAYQIDRIAQPFTMNAMQAARTYQSRLFCVIKRISLELVYD